MTGPPASARHTITGPSRPCPSRGGSRRSRSCEGLKGLSDLKLRGSWAKTGNQSFGDYLAYSSYQLSDGLSSYQFGDTVFTTSRPSAVDPNIKWEETRAFNIGLDFGFANQRVSGAIDWYSKKTSDLLFKVPVAAFSNLSNFVTTNIGTMKNRGIEFSLSAKVLESSSRSGLNWNMDFTAAHNNNELTQITPFGGQALKILVGNVSGGVGTTIQVLQPGVPVNSFYVFTHIRENGKPIYKDVNGDRVDGIPNGVDQPSGSVCGREWGRHHQPGRSAAVPRPRAELDPGPFVVPGHGPLGFRLHAPGVPGQLRL